MSFSFIVDLENGADWEGLEDDNDDLPLRKVKKIDRLFDVSLVDIPAYENTEVYARSFELLENNLKTVEAERAKKREMIRRMRMKIKLGGIE